MTTRRRQLLWRRLLVGVSTIVVYAIVAPPWPPSFPSPGWPAIGDDQYSAQQAAIVPAMNLFTIATLGLAVVAPVTSRMVRAALGLAAAVLAAVAGPLLALIEAGTDLAFLTPGIITLALAGAAIGLTGMWVAERLALPDRRPVTPR